MFRIEKLSFSYDPARPVFREVDIDLDQAVINILTGDNGSGKSTLCRLLSGLLKDYQGRIILGGRDLKQLSCQQIANEIIYIKQEQLANIIAATPSEDLLIWQNRFIEREEPDNEPIRAALKRFRIHDLKDSHIWELSSGQLKRVGLSALLLYPEKFWIVDEPLNGLDKELKSLFLRIITEKSRSGTGALIVSHDLGMQDMPRTRILKIENRKVNIQR